MEFEAVPSCSNSCVTAEEDNTLDMFADVSNNRCFEQSWAAIIAEQEQQEQIEESDRRDEVDPSKPQKMMFWRLDDDDELCKISGIIKDKETDKIMYIMRWNCVSDPYYNSYPDNQWNTSLLHKDAVEEEFPRLLEKFKPTKKNTLWVVNRILGKTYVRGQLYYEVDWGKNTRGAERDKLLKTDPDVRNMIIDFEGMRKVSNGLRVGEQPPGMGMAAMAEDLNIHRWCIAHGVPR